LFEVYRDKNAGAVILSSGSTHVPLLTHDICDKVQSEVEKWFKDLE